jgi:hypothetical protein
LSGILVSLQRAVHDGYRSGESVAFARDGDDEARGIRVVIQCPANFPYRGIDGVFAVNKNTFAPDPFEDLVTANHLSATLNQQKQQFQRDAFETNDLTCARETVSVRV